jgi:glutamine cyclotransferase
VHERAFPLTRISLRSIRPLPAGERWEKRLSIALTAWLIGCAGALADACPPPKPLTFRVEGEIKRDLLGLTQGLELHAGVLFESTGAIAGDTRLITIDPGNGRVTVLKNFGRTFFGEGLTILREQIFQLSWKERQVFVYDLQGKLLRQMRNPREGWGLANDGQSLIFTDGGDRLHYADPATFEITGSVPIRYGATALRAVNELEYVDGKVYGNVFTTWSIVRIEPGTGCVDGIAELQALWGRMSPQERTHIASDSNFVLNGIAYDSTKDLFYLTGKNWRTIFTGRFVEAR